MYIAIRTDDGRNIGKISFYCSTLQVSRQAFYNYLERKGKPWKYQSLADAMLKIHDEDEENADYGRVRHSSTEKKSASLMVSKSRAKQLSAA